MICKSLDHRTALSGKTSQMSEIKVKMVTDLPKKIKMERIDMVKRENVLVYASESSQSKGFLRAFAIKLPAKFGCLCNCVIS